MSVLQPTLPYKHNMENLLELVMLQCSAAIALLQKHVDAVFIDVENTDLVELRDAIVFAELTRRRLIQIQESYPDHVTTDSQLIKILDEFERLQTKLDSHPKRANANILIQGRLKKLERYGINYGPFQGPATELDLT